jgi:hypothetical protein
MVVCKFASDTAARPATAFASRQIAPTRVAAIAGTLAVALIAQFSRAEWFAEPDDAAQNRQLLGRHDFRTFSA